MPRRRRPQVHIHTTPVSYYLNTGLLRKYTYDPIPIWPVYERYFSEPVTIADSFYVGRLFNTYRVVQHDPYAMYSCRQTLLAALNNGNEVYLHSTIHTDTSIGHLHTYQWEYYVWMYTGRDNLCPMLFPILTPEDTTLHHGDTLSVGSASLLDRLTGVMPNPASGSAKVVSSLGIKEVEVYNAAGDLMLRRQAEGLSHKLDTRDWPSGTYLLRIATPQGTATKKLLVRH